MQVDMSALSFDEIQEVMNVMSSFDNIFRDSSERERSLFLEMTIKRTLENPLLKNQRYIKDRPVIKSHYFFYRYCPTTSSRSCYY